MKGLKEKLRAISEGREKPPAIMATLGMEVVRVADGKATVKMHADHRFHNPMGTVHGGVMTDLADAAMGIALMSTLEDAESFTTLELKMNFLRPVYDDNVTAEATVLHRGRTIALVESVVKNGEGKEVARGIATQMLLPAK